MRYNLEIKTNTIYRYYDYRDATDDKKVQSFSLINVGKITKTHVIGKKISSDELIRIFIERLNKEYPKDEYPEYYL